MFKRMLCLLLALAAVLGLTAMAAEPGQVKVYVNGLIVEDASAAVDCGTTYVSISAMTRAMCPDAQETWEGAKMILRGTDVELTAQCGQAYIVMNGRYLYIPGGVRFENERLSAPIRVMAKAFNMQVEWDSESINVYCAPTPLLSGDLFYNPTDLDLISRVVMHESGNQPLAGKIGVAAVILNRVAAGSKAGFADTVSGVIYQKGQFTNATNAVPNAESIIAAKLAMDGADTVMGAKWFNGVGKPFWASRYKTLFINIGGHSFYG